MINCVEQITETGYNKKYTTTNKLSQLNYRSYIGEDLMKITDIKAFPVEVGGAQLVVKVETDEGIYGVGEAGMPKRALAVIGAIRHYREFLLGQDPMRIGALWQEMYRSQYFEGGRILTAAISGIDIALHDIAGKALGVPVYQLLGGKQRDYVPCFATTQVQSAEQLIADANLLIENGWNVIRTGMARSAPKSEENIFEPRESIALTADVVDRVARGNWFLSLFLVSTTITVSMLRKRLHSVIGCLPARLTFWRSRSEMRHRRRMNRYGRWWMCPSQLGRRFRTNGIFCLILNGVSPISSGWMSAMSVV